MAIGIIANPASGKDIRRLVSHATVIDNNEKLNLVKRAVLGALAMGTDEFIVMPDDSMIGRLIVDTISNNPDVHATAELLDMVVTSSADDTTTAANIMEQSGKVGCVIVLGGDGTCRAAAKSLVNTAILPISTGTNNVYPSVVEGTIAGMCAHIVDCCYDIQHCCIKDKRIEIYVNGEFRDMALVDAVISSHSIAGARAIWKSSEIIAVIAVLAHPKNIGFSSIIGSVQSVAAEDDFAYFVKLGVDEQNILAPIAPGVLERMQVSTPIKIDLNDSYEYTAESDCMIALDGEREISLRKGQTASFLIKRNGPWRVCVKKTMEWAQTNKLLK